MLPTVKFKEHTRSDFWDTAVFIVFAKERDACMREKGSGRSVSGAPQKHLIPHKVERGQLWNLVLMPNVYRSHPQLSLRNIRAPLFEINPFLLCSLTTTVRELLLLRVLILNTIVGANLDNYNCYNCVRMNLKRISKLTSIQRPPVGSDLLTARSESVKAYDTACN